MSRRSIISFEREKTNYESFSNVNQGLVIPCTIVDICGAHKPVTPFIKVEVDEATGIPKEGFYSSGVHFIIFDEINKEMTSVNWKKSYDELRMIYGEDNNIIGRRIMIHCMHNDKASIQNGEIHWEREDEILFEKESSYISLSGISGNIVNDYESQMKSFESPGVGKGRRWFRV